MTKFSRVISIFVIIFILEFIPAKITSAEYLIRPIPDNDQLPTTNYQPFDSSHGKPPTYNQFSSSSSAQLMIVDNNPNYLPSITFGDLLSSSDSSTLFINYSNNPQPTTYNLQQNSDSSRSALIRDLLARLDNSYQEAKLNQPIQQFNNLTIEQFNNSQNHSNSQPTTYNLQPSPTPYIPIPTLIAGINEIVRNNPSLSANYQLPTTNTSTQLSANYQPTPTPIISLIPLSISNQQSTITPAPKSIYSIALLGDSMIDTLGHDLADLQKLLKVAYPTKSFILLNYGQGATDMENGLFRLTHATTYLDKNYAPILSFKPDILVIESFAYNHWSGANYDLDRQWTTLVKIIETVKEISPDTKIVLAATISPNSQIFGDGKLNWNFDLKWESANLTKAYLENMSRFAEASHLPFADAYHSSIGTDGNGLNIYINNGDHLHPSPEGALLFSQKVVDAIINNRMIL